MEKEAKPIKVLIVDDEEIMRNLFVDILQDEGYQVTTVTNGLEAQEKVKKENFDVAFVDVHMPIMDGIKTLQSLRQLATKTGVVMMDSMPKYVLERFQDEGAVTCIHKPFDIREVRAVVKEIMDRRKSDA